jgi:hypothetical protein
MSQCPLVYRSSINAPIDDRFHRDAGTRPITELSTEFPLASFPGGTSTPPRAIFITAASEFPGNLSGLSFVVVPETYGRECAGDRGS